MKGFDTIHIAVWSMMFLPLTIVAGEITGIDVNPDPACVNSAPLIEVTGTGSCQQVSFQADVPNSQPQTVNVPSFPVLFDHTYTAVGTYTLSAGSSHPSCPGPGVTRQLTVQNCGGISAGQWNGVFELMNPNITGGFGLVQPGNEFPVVVFGEKFGPNEGWIILEGQFGSVPLTILEWGSNGTWASGFVPDVICGFPDHQATIRVVSSDGWSSKPWPAQFTAKRVSAVFPRSEVQVISCSHDSNKDCCNGQCDASDGNWFTACGTPNSSICGSHYNAWGAVGNDSGTDHYKVDLSSSFWRIEHVDFEPTFDPGEGFVQLQPNNSFHKKIGDFKINWEVTPNDNVFYDMSVHMSGPCGISHKSTFAMSILKSVLQNMEGMAGQGGMSARSLERFKKTERRVRAEQLRIAAVEDRKAQKELVRLRAGVTAETIAEAKRFQQVQADAAAFKLVASNPDADRKQLKAKARELKLRAVGTDTATAD